MRFSWSRRVGLVLTALVCLLIAGLAILLEPIVRDRANAPTLRLSDPEDLRTVSAQGVGPLGSAMIAGFELPRRYHDPVRRFFDHPARRWGRPRIPDEACVAQIRFLDRGNSTETLDIYDVGPGQVGVGLRGGRVLFDTPGQGAIDLLNLLRRASAWEGIPPVTEISLKRTMCLGTCPQDEITFRSDGVARYEGGQHVTRIGKFTGTVAPEAFRRLAKLIDDGNFARLNGIYSVMVSDAPTQTTTVRWGSTVKPVVNHGRAGPESLIELEAAIVSTVEQVAWTPVP